MSPFKEKVIQAVQKIPYGKVTSYGQIALYVGFPRGARQVGWILNSTERTPQIKIPWWRVINNAGRISIKGTLYNDASIQRKLLLGEGVVVSDDFKIDIEKYRWLPKEKEIKQLELNKKYAHEIIEKYKI
jgi:methylated-DNA-protein-cysteine methyltransferase related protein